MRKTGDIVFTGTRLGLLVRLPEEGHFELLRQKLAERLDANPEFFQGASVLVDVGRRRLSSEELRQLESLFRGRAGLYAVQVIGGENAPGSAGEVGKRVEGGGAPARDGHDPLWDAASRERETLIVRRTLRSGQRIRFSGNVVVLGDVNPGAEITAAGDVIVIGQLRGMVHAGATGRSDAVVVAYRLQPTQLRIADVISRPPDGEAAGPREPEFAQVREGQIVIEPRLAGT